MKNSIKLAVAIAVALGWSSPGQAQAPKAKSTPAAQTAPATPAAPQAEAAPANTPAPPGWIALSLAAEDTDWGHVEARLKTSYRLAAPRRLSSL